MYLRLNCHSPPCLDRVFQILSRSTPAPCSWQWPKPWHPRAMTTSAFASSRFSSANIPDALSHRVREEYHRGIDVWTMFNGLAFPTAVNLGQGAMSFAPPSFVREAIKGCVGGERADTHHYAHPRGRPRLRQALSEYLSDSLHISTHRLAEEQGTVPPPVANMMPSGLPRIRPRHGRRLDPDTEILVTAGANGGIYSALAAFLDPGDEVVMLEPAFDQYYCEVTFSEGRPVYVPLIPPFHRSGDAVNGHGYRSEVSSAQLWAVDWPRLERALASPRAKILLFNTPHNPIGKVFSEAELARVAQLCIKHDILVVSDEVYDCLTFDAKPHLRIAAFEGMWERTITVGSAGKSFACTGWRIGWLVGPSWLIKPCLAVHTRIVFCANSAASEAVAIALEVAGAQNFFEVQRHEYDERRRALENMLRTLGLPYTRPEGAYFIIVDLSSLQVPADFDMPEEISRRSPDYHRAWFVAKVCDVLCIPATAFAYSEEASVYDRFVRFSFCRSIEEIEEAGRRLRQLLPFLKQ